jgi:hypothetical protein
MKPTIGRIVHYKLSDVDAKAINKRRADASAYQRSNSGAEPGDPGATGHQLHVGNHAEAGQVFPAQIVRIFDPEGDSGTSNLQVFLDGNDTYWATSRKTGNGEGDWTWPPRA